MSQAPKDDKDRAADALSALAAGQHADDAAISGSGMEGHAQVELRKHPRPGPVPAQPPLPRAQGAVGSRPPVAPKPRPSMPQGAQAAAPDAASLAHQQEVAREAEAMAHIVEDDDTLNMPAASPDLLAHRRPAPPPRKRVVLSRTVGFKQTLIPILLTLGVLLPGIAVWSFALGEESVIAGIPWVAFMLMGIGLVMLALAALTMVQVKHQLDQGR
jgi:hypothetical protein